MGQANAIDAAPVMPTPSMQHQRRPQHTAAAIIAATVASSSTRPRRGGTNLYRRTGTLVRWPNTTANQRTTKRRRVRKRQKKRKRESLELALLESSETRLVGQLDAAKSPWSGVGANDVDDLPIGFEVLQPTLSM